MTILRDVPFIVSPAAHGEPRDVSETSNKQTNKQTKNKKHRGAFRDYAEAPNTVKTQISTAFK